MPKSTQHWLERIWNVLSTGLSINPGDLEIGAVEIKDGTTDNRAVVSAAGGVLATIDQDNPGTTNKVWADPVTAAPTVYNVTLTIVDTEYSQAMPANCRRIEFHCQDNASMRFAFVTGKVAGPVAPYMTLKIGYAYDSGEINQAAAPSTVYFASATAGAIVEIIAWI